MFRLAVYLLFARDGSNYSESKAFLTTNTCGKDIPGNRKQLMVVLKMALQWSSFTTCPSAEFSTVEIRFCFSTRIFLCSVRKKKYTSTG